MPIHDPRNVNEHLSLAKKRDLRTYRNTLSPVVEYRERKRERERGGPSPHSIYIQIRRFVWWEYVEDVESVLVVVVRVGGGRRGVGGRMGVVEFFI